jgi:hypothetical protein
VIFHFEDKVRKNNNLDSSVYFHNLTPDVQNLYNDYLILRTTILDLKNCRNPIAHPVVNPKKFSKQLFVDFCLQKKICNEEQAKFIFEYSYEN